MEMSEMLEDSQWQTSSLCLVRRPMGSSWRFNICPTSTWRLSPRTQSWEKCPQEFWEWPTASRRFCTSESAIQKHFSQAEEATRTEEEARGRHHCPQLCCSGNASSLESWRWTNQRSADLYNVNRGCPEQQSRDDSSTSLGLSRPSSNAGGCEKGCRQVRRPNHQADHLRDASHHQCDWEISQDLAWPSGCESQTSHSMAAPSSVFARTLKKQMDTFDEQQKDYADRIQSARKEIQISRRTLQRLNSQAAEAALPLAEVEDEEQMEMSNPDAEENKLRDQVHACSSQAVHECLQQRSHRSLWRRGRRDGASYQQAPPLNRALWGTRWRCILVSVGSGCLSPEVIGPHEPALAFSSDFIPGTEAYDERCAHCAACPWERFRSCIPSLTPSHFILFYMIKIVYILFMHFMMPFCFANNFLLAPVL